MRVGIIGSRDCRDCGLSLFEGKLPEDCTMIVSGGAKGIDSLAEEFAAMRGIPFTKYEPDYAAHGKRAPLLRNIKIIENSDMVLAFWDFYSRGTAHVIAECLKRGVPIRIYSLVKEEKAF